jgi:hypothetical protein
MRRDSQVTVTAEHGALTDDELAGERVSGPVQGAGGTGDRRLRSSLESVRARRGRNRILLRTGCLIFAPFFSMTIWFLQAVVWLMLGTPILIYALVMAALGGGVTRDHRRH